MTKLGINVDHIATLRQARREPFPDPVDLAKAAIAGGADGITVHLREDRRHIQDHDVIRMKKNISVPFNLEMAANPEIVKIALDVKPDWCCLVPEKREELTTEGGLNVVDQFDQLNPVVGSLQKSGIKVSLFIDADQASVKKSAELKTDAVEFHTGAYARAWHVKNKADDCCSGTGLALRSGYEMELKKIVAAAKLAKENKIIVNAGHGLDYENVQALTKAFSFHEYNIGFAIIAKSVYIGMEAAVRSMKEIIKEAVCAES